MISLDSSKQPDSLGYNLVESIPKLLADGIHNGTIPIWDSPDKEKNLSGKFIRQLETANHTEFSSQRFLFLYELWNNKKNVTTYKILGMSFIGQKSNDTLKFNYGYIDITDIEHLLKTSFIPVNINGSFKTTFWEALNHRDYPFSLLQLGNRYYTDYDLALKNKNKYFSADITVNPYFNIPEVKKVNYAIALDTIKDSKAMVLLNAISEHYHNHPEELYNPQSRKLFSKNRETKFKTIEISAVWTKDVGKVISHPHYLLLHTDFSTVDTLYADNLEKWEDRIEDQGVIRYLEANNFDSQITAINDITIDHSMADKACEALRFFPWNNINARLKK